MPVTAGGIAFSGVYAATTTTPLRDDGRVDFDEFAEHCGWLADEGVACVVPNGSFGEYETLSDAERAQMVTTSVTAVGGRIPVVPGVTAARMYRAMLPALRWDADPRFVQAIKLAQEEAGRYGGPVRLPRLPLPPGEAAEVRTAVRAAARAMAEAGA